MTAPIPADMPIRPAFWNVPLWGEIGVYVLGLAAAALCAWGIWRNVQKCKLDAGAAPLPEEKGRLKRALAAAFLQKRVRETGAGRVHFVLALGFFLLFLGTATATLDWDVGHYVFGSQFLKGDVYLFYKLVLDCAGVAVLAALALGLWRRYAMPSGLPRDNRFLLAYSSLALVILTGYFVEALRLAVQQPAWIDFSPVGSILAELLLAAAGKPALEAAHTWLWVIHGVMSLAFIAAIPATFYAHIYRTPAGIYARKPEPMGRLEKIENIEEQETFGLSKIEQLSRAERMSIDGCTECGRCNVVCPAVRAGTPLSPRAIILKLRDRAAMTAQAREADGKSLVGDVVTHEELFSCTTCGACARVCPAEIQTPDLIVKMRRHLALEQGEFPEGAAAALENTASVGNPWGMDPYERLDWAKDLDVPVAQAGEKYDVLYWVGCAASYDRRARKIARAMVKILRAAGVRFAVMAEERCHAEFARRLGEEYLFQTALQENLENLSQYQFDRILTACPHCFNTLKNEYSDFENGRYAVVSHADFIAELIDAGKLPKLEAAGELTVYHDPCYLARWNGIVEAPRRVLSAACTRTTEPPESGELGFCCGAGGGQMWSEQKLGKKRIQTIRIESLASTGAKRIAAACPHCVTMLESAKSLRPDGDELRVADIAELVAEALPEAPSADEEAR